MRFFPVRLSLFVIASGIYSLSFAQVKTNTQVLRESAANQSAKENLEHARLIQLARQKGWDTLIKKPNGNISKLVGVDAFGIPLYISTENNITAAATIGTDKLWPGGSLGLSLSGSSDNVKGKLALWDGGKVRSTHVELAGRVTQKDNSPSNNDHATHVAGTLIASGVNPYAKGMSFGLKELLAYDFTNDNSEMLAAAPDLLISNHSYGFNAGWNYNTNENPARWEFLGKHDAVEDYKFGYYSSGAQLWDSIAYNAPYYLIVKSAGNNRNENGPAVGQPYWGYNAGGVMVSKGNRPEGISSNDGYDILSTNSNAKNILVVGAVNPLSTGYSRPEDVVLSDFSSWGPTDDGRIKPDVVAMGVDVFSSVATSNNAYATYDGTSMSSPNAAGSLLLLQEYYSQLHNDSFMRSATLKGLIIHTADEAGPSPGPDYKHGWGLINMKKAAEVIKSNNTGHLIQENVLNNGDTLRFDVVASGDGVLRATISWTDPKAPVEPEAIALNNPTKKLINDLDIVIKKGGTVYRPWVLTPTVPAAAATRGNNTLDNVERIDLPDVVPGDIYTIEISHKGTLERGLQAYSLLVSGVAGQAFCSSAPSNNGGARIDSVAFANIRQKNPDGCTSYTSYTNLSGTVEPGQTIPIFINLNSCDASAADKIVKVFIDANNDGDFTDPGETLATSGVINGNGNFTGTITIPNSLAPGKYSILRIVMQETNNAANVTPCGSYAKGETQDYRLRIINPSVDFGITQLISPEPGNCESSAEYVVVRVRNFGAVSKNNIPLTAIIKQGSTTIATLTETYKTSITGQTDRLHIFQTPVELSPNQSYTITVSTAFAGDQDPSNDEMTFNFTTSSKATAPTGTAVICGTTARLNVTAASGQLPYSWYSSASAASPLTYGTNTTTTTIQPKYYLSSGEIPKLGVANKQVFADGGYNVFVNNVVKFTTYAPVKLETARMYIGTPGKLRISLRQIVSENETSYSYYPIDSREIDVYATAPTPPVLGAQNNDPADLGAVFYLGMTFPQAANYYLVMECLDGASIFRNNNINSTQYPYTIPGVISLTGNSASTTAEPNNHQRFYYFFYDMNLKVPYCASDRVPITATTAPTPVITLDGNTLKSSSETGNQWLLNGSMISGATSQTYTPTENGIYSVRVTNNSCTLVSNQINFTTTAVVNVDPQEIGMTVSPNPAPGGNFTLQLQTNTRSNLDIMLVNLTGQVVYKMQIPSFSGRLTKLIEPGKLAPGVYYLKVVHDKKAYIRKLVVLQ